MNKYFTLTLFHDFANQIYPFTPIDGCIQGQKDPCKNQVVVLKTAKKTWDHL